MCGAYDRILLSENSSVAFQASHQGVGSLAKAYMSSCSDTRVSPRSFLFQPGSKDDVVDWVLAALVASPALLLCSVNLSTGAQPELIDGH
jgi:hypothetical protein